MRQFQQPQRSRPGELVGTASAWLLGLFGLVVVGTMIWGWVVR